MAVKSIDILNMLVFQSRKRTDPEHRNDSEKGNEKNAGEAFHLDFGDGINVLIGENGVGKTTILKMIYAAAKNSEKKNNPAEMKSLLQYFSSNLGADAVLKNGNDQNGFSYYRVSDGACYFEEDYSGIQEMQFRGWEGLDIQAVFIPTTEMLSHSKGFLALNQKYHMPFDITQVDIIVNASLPETREIPESMKGMLHAISKVIDGTVVLEKDSFYVIKNGGQKIEFSLEAEGLRKLGLLWKLIRNGLLEKGTILLWDEPEANLNPEMYPVVADVLLELQKNGVQIFAATHSYNFSKYLEIRRTKKEQVFYHNLYKADDGIVCVKSAYRMEELEKNPIMEADSKLLDEVYGQ